MPVPIACLSESFTTVNTFKRQLIVVDPKMIPQIANLRKCQRTMVTFQDLVKTAGLWILLIVDCVVFVLERFLVWIILLIR